MSETKKPKSYQELLEELQQTRIQSDFLVRPRLWVTSRLDSAVAIREELSSSKQKERDEVYKFFSPMESHRGTDSKHDPAYLEANLQWAETASGRNLCKFYGWHVKEGQWRLVLTYEEWQTLTVPEENEFGVVSP